jgi:hypothetical protein
MGKCWEIEESLGLRTSVIVRLQRDDSEACWEATFATAIRNDVGRFTARSK